MTTSTSIYGAEGPREMSYTEANTAATAAFMAMIDARFALEAAVKANSVKAITEAWSAYDVASAKRALAQAVATHAYNQTATAPEPEPDPIAAYDADRVGAYFAAINRPVTYGEGV